MYLFRYIDKYHTDEKQKGVVVFMIQHIRFLVFAILILLTSNSFAKEIYIVASDATWPPLESLDEHKKVIGYSTDYITAVAHEAGFKVEVRNAAWDGIFAALNADLYDIIASSVTITDKRKQKVMDFSEPYYTVHQAIVVPKDSAIKTMSDINGKKIGGQIGTSGLVETLPKAHIKATIKTYDEIGLAFEDLMNGSLDAVICDQPVASYFIDHKPDYAEHMKIAFINKNVEQYAFAVKKGNKELLEKINKGIRAVKEKGIENALIKKWLDT